VPTWLVALPVGAVLRSVVRGGPWDERLVVFTGVPWRCPLCSCSPRGRSGRASGGSPPVGRSEPP